MNESGRPYVRLWYLAALLFALSAAVLFFHRDVASGCFWLIMSALGVIFATAKRTGNGGDPRSNHSPDATTTVTRPDVASP